MTPVARGSEGGVTEGEAKRLGEIAETALDVARAAGELILRHYHAVEAELKADGSHVTVADREAEQLIRERLARHFPAAAVLGEEFGGERRPLPGDQWIVDPLDGTTPFVLGLPLFGVLLGLLRDGDPVVGVAHFPALGETLWAARGGGCWHQRAGVEARRVRVDPVGELGRAFVSVSGVHRSELDATATGPRLRLASLASAAGRFRVVGDSIQHGMVCQGRLHDAYDAIKQPWDTEALVPCEREAVGVAASLEADDAGEV
jgi:histidinol-phosphatase